MEWAAGTCPAVEGARRSGRCSVPAEAAGGLGPERCTAEVWAGGGSGGGPATQTFLWPIGAKLLKQAPWPVLWLTAHLLGHGRPAWSSRLSTGSPGVPKPEAERSRELGLCGHWGQSEGVRGRASCEGPSLSPLAFPSCLRTTRARSGFLPHGSSVLSSSGFQSGDRGGGTSL